MAFDDSILNADDKARVSAFQDAWNSAKAAGDQAGMTAAHSGAEQIRAKYGYSGGAGGDQYVQTGENTQLPRVSANEAPTLYAGQSQEAAIQSLYDAKAQAAQQNLTNAYNQKLLEYDYNEQKLPAAYNQAREQTSAQHEIERQNYNEYAAGNGINTGASSQVRLSQNNQYLRDMNAINAAQAQAMQELQFERTKAKAAYQDAIAQAIMDNDVQRAQALYQEYQRVDDNLVTASMNQANLNLSYQQAAHQQALDQANLDLTRDDVDYNRKADAAKTLAQYGDFSGYKEIGYTDDQIATMRYMWEVMNGFAGGSSSGGGGSGRDKGNGNKDDGTEGPGVKDNTQKAGSGAMLGSMLGMMPAAALRPNAGTAAKPKNAGEL